MPRILPVFAICFCFGASCGLSGQTPDPRLDEANKEIALLKRLVADQERRIGGLENAVRSLQTTVLAATRAVTTARGRTPEGWAAVKVGMSRAQVVEILGEPTSTDAVIDRQTLFYKAGPDPIGNVILVDDRVSEVASQRFQIRTPSSR